MKSDRIFYKTLIASILLLCLCLNSPLNAKVSNHSKKSESGKAIKARITFYYPNEAKSGFKSAKGDRLIPWKSAAVCFRTIPYGSKISIPGLGNFVAQDTGSAVISRKAAKKFGKNVPVIDVCVPNRAEMNRIAHKFPKFIEVQIQRPS